MCTADGKYLTYDAYHGNLSTRPRPAGWPRRPSQLPPNHWTLWKHALEQCILAPGTADRKLLNPVGNWLPIAITHWKWYFSPQEQRLYHRTPDGFEAFSRAPTPTRPSSSRFRPTNLLDAALPADALLATVAKLTADRYQLTGSSPIPPADPAIDPPYHTMSLDQIFQSRPSLDRWAVDMFHSPDDGHLLASGILQGRATAVSDGS